MRATRSRPGYAAMTSTSEARRADQLAGQAPRSVQEKRIRVPVRSAPMISASPAWVNPAASAPQPADSPWVMPSIRAVIRRVRVGSKSMPMWPACHSGAVIAMTPMIRSFAWSWLSVLAAVMAPARVPAAMMATLLKAWTRSKETSRSRLRVTWVSRFMTSRSPRGAWQPAVSAPVQWHKVTPAPFDVGRTKVQLDDTYAIGLYELDQRFLAGKPQTVRANHDLCGLGRSCPVLVAENRRRPGQSPCFH